MISASMLNFLNQGGLIEEIHLIFMLNTVVPYFVNLVIEPDIWIRMFRNYRLNNFLKNVDEMQDYPNDPDKVKKVIDGPIFTQRQAHDVVGSLPYDISDHYSTVFSTIALSFFYFPIFPFGIWYSIVSMILMYFTSKVEHV